MLPLAQVERVVEGEFSEQILQLHWLRDPTQAQSETLGIPYRGGFAFTNGMPLRIGTMNRHLQPFVAYATRGCLSILGGSWEESPARSPSAPEGRSRAEAQAREEEGDRAALGRAIRPTCRCILERPSEPLPSPGVAEIKRPISCHRAVGQLRRSDLSVVTGSRNRQSPGGAASPGPCRSYGAGESIRSSGCK